MAAPTTLPTYYQFTPRSISDREWWQQVASHPRAAAAMNAVEKLIETAPKQPAGPFASEFLAAKWKNDRAAVDGYWQRTRGVLTGLILKRCIEGGVEAGNDLPLLDWLWHYLTMPTWVVSAHLPNNELPDTLAPQFDLAATEMAAFMAETLEVLLPWVDAQSSTLKKSFINEIDRRVLKPFGDGAKIHWADEETDHINNWSGVCAGSILAACEALARLGHPRPAARERAIKVLDLFLRRGFTLAGECDEGLGYWAYGVGYAVLGWSRLTEEEFRRSTDQKRFAQVVDYPRQVHLFDNTFFSGNDASLNCKAPLFATPWLAGATQQPFFIEWSRNAGHDAWGMRNLCVALRALDGMTRLPDGPAVFPAMPRSRFVTDQQVGIFNDGDLTIAFSGGTNGEAHNHNDLGHFNVWVGKKCIIPDLGAPQYQTDFFKPATRYTKYLSAASRGHCCPIINGIEQRTGQVAHGELLTLDLEKQVLSIDMTSAYPAEAKLARWSRACRSLGNSAYEISDEFCTTTASTIENVVWSTVKPEVTDNTLKLGPLTLVASKPDAITVAPVNPKDHLLRDFKETLYRIGIKYKTEQDVPVKVTLTINAASN